MSSYLFFHLGFKLNDLLPPIDIPVKTPQQKGTAMPYSQSWIWPKYKQANELAHCGHDTPDRTLHNFSSFLTTYKVIGSHLEHNPGA